MIVERWSEVSRYFPDPTDPRLVAESGTNTAAAPSPPPIATPRGSVLELFARIQGTHRILEIGTGGGYSTVRLARGLPPGGRLIALEPNPQDAEVARETIARAGLTEVVQVREGPALSSLPALAAEGRGPFDLIFIDGDRPAYPEYLSWALKLSRRGSVILADNVIPSQSAADAASADRNVRGVRRFHELLAAEQRVSATAIRTVGRARSGGYAVAFVTSDP
ncbi:MAG: O-methyltransferase [Thermoplasmata archaeon]